MFSSLAIVISLVGVIHFLLAVAVVALLVLGLKWLFAQLQWSVPQPIWAVLGFILFLVVLLYALGAFGGGGVSFR